MFDFTPPHANIELLLCRLETTNLTEYAKNSHLDVPHSSHGNECLVERQENRRQRSGSPRCHRTHARLLPQESLLAGDRTSAGRLRLLLHGGARRPSDGLRQHPGGRLPRLLRLRAFQQLRRSHLVDQQHRSSGAVGRSGTEAGRFAFQAPLLHECLHVRLHHALLEMGGLAARAGLDGPARIRHAPFAHRQRGHLRPRMEEDGHDRRGDRRLRDRLRPPALVPHG